MTLLCKDIAAVLEHVHHTKDIDAEDLFKVFLAHLIIKLPLAFVAGVGNDGVDVAEVSECAVNECLDLLLASYIGNVCPQSVGAELELSCELCDLICVTAG